eukprot:1180787-Prorocentrum_minimum.AAC.1
MGLNVPQYGPQEGKRYYNQQNPACDASRAKGERGGRKWGTGHRVRKGEGIRIRGGFVITTENVDVKEVDVDVKGAEVDVKGVDVDIKGVEVDVKGVDDDAPFVDA